jgi:predicted Zn-ribbon and HTH transcriptional regulator
MLCPRCKADHAHRSHRKGVVERLGSWIGYYPYRCRECGYRFLQFRYAIPPESPGKHSETEREIRTTRVRIRWKRKKRALLLYGFGALIFLSFLYYITRPGNFSGN